MIQRHLLIPALMAIGGLAACSGASSGNNAAVSNNATEAGIDNVSSIPEDGDATAMNDGAENGAAIAVADQWLGRWTGPEGLFLDIAAGSAAGEYKLTLKDNLDSQADYVGKAVAQGIAFTRAGKTVTIHAGTGEETGFKYLLDKKDCLILEKGKEGYCRQ